MSKVLCTITGSHRYTFGSLRRLDGTWSVQKYIYIFYGRGHVGPHLVSKVPRLLILWF